MFTVLNTSKVLVTLRMDSLLIWWFNFVIELRIYFLKLKKKITVVKLWFMWLYLLLSVTQNMTSNGLCDA